MISNKFFVIISITICICTGCNPLDKTYDGFVINKREKSKDITLSPYPNEIDSIVKLTFDEKYVPLNISYKITSTQVSYAWVKEYRGPDEREYLDTNNYNVIVDYYLERKKNRIRLILNKHFKIRLKPF